MSIRASFIRSLLVLSSLTLAGSAFARRPPALERAVTAATVRADGYRDMLARRSAAAPEIVAASAGYRDMLARAPAGAPRRAVASTR